MYVRPDFVPQTPIIPKQPNIQKINDIVGQEKYRELEKKSFIFCIISFASLAFLVIFALVMNLICTSVFTSQGLGQLHMYDKNLVGTLISFSYLGIIGFMITAVVFLILSLINAIKIRKSGINIYIYEDEGRFVKPIRLGKFSMIFCALTCFSIIVFSLCVLSIFNDKNPSAMHILPVIFVLLSFVFSLGVLAVCYLYRNILNKLYVFCRPTESISNA